MIIHTKNDLGKNLMNILPEMPDAHIGKHFHIWFPFNSEFDLLEAISHELDGFNIIYKPFHSA